MGIPMNMINRAALIVIPKQPYIDWANTLDEEGPKLDINDPHYESSVYLADNIVYESDIVAILKRYYRIIFEHELASWYLDTRAWPQKRGFRTFKAWFEVKVSSVVPDLCKDPIEVEEFEV